MAPSIQNPLLPAGSLILMVAANGLIASHVVDQLLGYGYAVRGTVRSLARCSWMAPLFEERHPDSRLEIIEIPDIAAPGCYDAALKGVSAVIFTPANTELAEGPDVIELAIKGNHHILESVAKANKAGEKILRVVLTSSSWAVMYPKPNTPVELTYDTYETSAQSRLEDPDLPKEQRGLMMYVATKTRCEQESWKWIKEHPDAGFALNSVLPATCMGPVLSPENQQYPSTAGFIRSLYEGKNTFLFEWLAPQWFVDLRDAARLHVAGAVLTGIEGERIFGWAAPYTWPGVAAVLEQEMGQKVLVELKDKGEDLTKPPMERSMGYLKRLGQSGWEEFGDSVRRNIRSYYPKI